MDSQASQSYGRIETDGKRVVSLLEKVSDVSKSQDPVLINISRYVLPGRFLKVLAETPVDQGLGEFRITDGLLRVIDSAADDPILVHEVDGRYLDIGNERGLLEAWQSLLTVEPSSGAF